MKEFQMQKCWRVRPHTLNLKRADSPFTLSKCMHHWKYFSKLLLLRTGALQYWLLLCHYLVEGFGKYCWFIWNEIAWSISRDNKKIDAGICMLSSHWIILQGHKVGLFVWLGFLFVWALFFFFFLLTRQLFGGATTKGKTSPLNAIWLSHKVR